MSKKSLVQAQERALFVSNQYPQATVRVMDKKGCNAVVSSSEWVYKERVLEGYHTVGSYKGGVAL